MYGKPVQDLGDLELVVEVVLEPEDDFIMASKAAQYVVAERQVGMDRLEAAPFLIRQETGTHGA